LRRLSRKAVQAWERLALKRVKTHCHHPRCAQSLHELLRADDQVLLPEVPPKSPTKAPRKATRKPPPTDSPTTPKATRDDMPDLNVGVGTAPNVKIHHEYPFSPEDALRKEGEAIAQFEALQKLIGTAGHAFHPTSGGVKGPRETYETTTSGPSFGHLHHRDNMPTSRHVSYQPELIGDPPVMGSALFHIPFGGNFGIPLPRAPITLRRLPVSGLADEPVLNAHVLGDSLADRHKRSDRSAFVESVTDVSIRQFKSG
jgi:hypothetical protein